MAAAVTASDQPVPTVAPAALSPAHFLPEAAILRPQTSLVILFASDVKARLLLLAAKNPTD